MGVAKSAIRMTIAPLDISLLTDSALVLRVDPELHAAALPWIPRPCGPVHSCDENGAMLIVEPAGRGDHRRFDEPPTITVDGVRAHVDGDDVWLLGPSGLSGRIELARRRATLSFDVRASALDVQGALTLASALLLGRLGRVLVHAAAVMDPRGRACLLVGDSHFGKVATSSILLAFGWQHVADEYVVLSAEGGGLRVEGWPRVADLDSGWIEGRINTRIATDTIAFGPTAWAPSASLSGLWFPVVAGDDSRGLFRLAAATVLDRLVRESPWALADGAVASSALELLTRAARLPCAALRLGRDSYANAMRFAGYVETVAVI